MDDYVECSGCGHPLERHTMKGCDQQVNGCTCTESWTVKEIREQRRQAGLPVTYKSWEF